MRCELLITGCRDHQMWYSHLVGQRVPLLAIEPDCYLSREPAGFTNMVYKQDAEVVPAQEYDK
ncbi:hypothetical protein [Ectopseudomonas oleovorans]|uniref:Uncharacterized protein n=1 Tax=Ectopseudomonas oleovorans (strain CECT 5344) TaxID=1182590 RepID=W6R7N6_ECTO5|nr:hypothetical protein [Pseudomonas oleovorans]CDM42396.1 hypothetical protein BN5_3854 [Pseudomonas oleovorans CECT 5344]CDR93019.1 hypothetical protein PPSAL_3795 [Pseudomonas oleovorans]